MICFVCSSDNHVDTHHYDCMRGKISSKTVPLCRRCHTTYHNWGIGSFSPDTTAKILEVENSRREILRSMPADHPLYNTLHFSRQEAQTILKLEDVRHTRYWYKKWGITPPKNGNGRKPRAIPLEIPNGEPICGRDWLEIHLNDHTVKEIEALTIEIACGNRWLPVSVAEKKGKVKSIMREVPE